MDGSLDDLREVMQRDPEVRLAVKLAYYRRHPEFYFKDQLRIRTKDGTLEPFMLWACQKPVLDLMLQQRKDTGRIRVVCLKARQVGMSTLSEALMAWAVMLNPNTNGLIVAHDAATAETLFSITKTYYDHLDPKIRPLKRYSTKKEFVFENPDDDTRPANPGLGSRLVITSANNIHSGIGRTLRAVHISEAARYPNAEGIVDGIFPALAKKDGTICVIESTAQYSGEWFKSLCERSKAGEGEFRFIFVPWYLQPDYQVPLLRGERLRLSLDERHMMDQYPGLTLEHIKWYRQELATLGDELLFKQSYPFTEEEAWITPGDQVFPWPELDWQRKEHVRQPLRICTVMEGPRILDDPGGKCLIWEEPIGSQAYDIGVDVALGTEEDDQADSSRDWSVICVMKRGANEQVAEWRSRSTDVMDLAKICAALGYYYNQAQIAVEINGIGIATNMHLSKMGYPNMYVWRYRDEVSPRFTKKIGWDTSLRSKRWLISYAVHQLVNKEVVIRSAGLLEEMRQFVHLGHDRYGGAAGSHDDRVMAWMIAMTTSDDENFGKWFGGETGREEKAVQDNPIALEIWNHDGTFQTQGQYEKDHVAWD